MSLPTLVVVSGPPGAGKTTLAHALARAIGCPAICRDEIKEGMAHANPEGGASLNIPAMEAFFATLEVLLRAGTTVVAEAAYQDRLWRPGLERLMPLANVRIVHCEVDPRLAYARTVQRAASDPRHFAAHGPAPEPQPDVPFDRVNIDAPAMVVDTSDGYRPSLERVVEFVNGG